MLTPRIAFFFTIIHFSQFLLSMSEIFPQEPTLDSSRIAAPELHFSRKHHGIRFVAGKQVMEVVGFHRADSSFAFSTYFKLWRCDDHSYKPTVPSVLQPLTYRITSLHCSRTPRRVHSTSCIPLPVLSTGGNALFALSAALCAHIYRKNCI